MSSSNINGVFYADSYYPIQAGSIDGTDTLPHDNGVYRALLCSSAGLYDPFGDPKVIGDPYCTLFVGRLSHLTDEESLRMAMSKYGRVKNLRLVRHIVTGASRGYAFVEYETEREMRRAYEDAHHSKINDSEVIVDYNRQQLMTGWIPRRLGGGLGGQKESGQLRFGGRERPFRAPLRPIPYDDLKRLGIPPPPEGRYMSRFQVPSPPRRRSNRMNMEYSPSRPREDSPERKRRSEDREEPPSRWRRSSIDIEDSSRKHYRESSRQREDSPSKTRRSEDREEPPSRWRRSSIDIEDSSRKHYRESSRQREDSPSKTRRSEDREDPPTTKQRKRSSTEREDSSRKHYRESSRQREDSPSRKRRSEDMEEPSSRRRRRSSTERESSSHKHRRHHS